MPREPLESLTALIFLACPTEDLEHGRAIVETSAEYEALPPGQRHELLADWITRLRELYCYVRDEAEAEILGEVEIDGWAFLNEVK